VGGTVTRRPRRGNRKPRIARRQASQSIVNAMGLPNRGAEEAARQLRAGRPAAPVFVSIADEDRSDVVANHELLEPLADAVELNVSCPNVSWGRDRDNEEHLRGLTGELGPRKERPLFVKLPPVRTQAE